eukprot:gene4255-4306_t
MRRRVEIRLAHHQVHDRPAFPAQRVGPIGGGGAGRRLDAPNACGDPCIVHCAMT